MSVTNIPVLWRKNTYSNGQANCVEVTVWRKSSYSNGEYNCVEVAAWRKSRYSNGQANCVEVGANLPRMIAVRDSKDPDGAALAFSPDRWQAFTRRVKAGAAAQA